MRIYVYPHADEPYPHADEPYPHADEPYPHADEPYPHAETNNYKLNLFNMCGILQVFMT